MLSFMLFFNWPKQYPFLAKYFDNNHSRYWFKCIISTAQIISKWSLSERFFSFFLPITQISYKECGCCKSYVHVIKKNMGIIYSQESRLNMFSSPISIPMGNGVELIFNSCNQNFPLSIYSSSCFWILLN
jgi:hypothetical protein